jgi:predicted RNA-binding protein with PUA-like domain
VARWLFKQEPDTYPLAQLKADGTTLWDGITNPQALQFLRQCTKGDEAFYYHTGDEKSVVGILKITGPAVADETNPKLVAVPVKYHKTLKKPVTLAAIKSEEAFADWHLVKNSRLSVMPCPDELWDKIIAMGSG